MDEISSESGQSVELSLGIPRVKCNIPAVCPPALLKRRTQRGEASLRLQVTLDVRQEYTYSSHPVGLLRGRREGPRDRRAAHELDEFPPSHVPPYKDHGLRNPQSLALCDRAA